MKTSFVLGALSAIVLSAASVGAAHPVCALLRPGPTLVSEFLDRAKSPKNETQIIEGSQIRPNSQIAPFLDLARVRSLAPESLLNEFKKLSFDDKLTVISQWFEDLDSFKEPIRAISKFLESPEFKQSLNETDLKQFGNFLEGRQISIMGESDYWGAVREATAKPEASKARFPFFAKLRELLLVRQPTLDGPITVVYPGSGYDSTTPGALFPRAELIVGIDAFPFTNVEKLSSLSYLETSGFRSQKFTNVNVLMADLTKDPSIVARKIIAGIQASHPSARIQKVMVLREDLAGREFAPTHGLVIYDQGPDTPTQYYLHINAEFSVSSPVEKFWWSKFLKGSNPQVLLVQSISELFNPLPAALASAWVPPQPEISGLREYFLALVQSQSGVIIEGRNQRERNPEKYEFTRSSDNFLKRWQAVWNLPFGYKGEVQAIGLISPTKD